MTRRVKTLPSVQEAGNLVRFVPLSRARSLTAEVVQRLESEIDSGALAPGAQLPTEQGMMTAFGVSRTVIREAVAALRADGLVTTRQGSGAFVASDPGRRAFRIAPEGLGSIEHVLHVLELRLAVEVEAVALASRRANKATARGVVIALKAFEAAIHRNETAIAEDFGFHLAIAQATGNPYFVSFLEFLGRFIIPRQSIRASEMTSEQNALYLENILGEHRAICDAIVAAKPEEARDAMRIHLGRSGKRYRAFAKANT